MLLVGLTSCSTKKNSFTRRLFHNVTGHYNMFWNGRESYREGVADLNKQIEENYNRVLPVYNYGTEQQATSMNPNMDKAIEKASLNIQRHSMYFNRKEYVRWIDDSYMLIGLGYFYKQDYNKARRTFDFIINEYKNNDIRYDAMLWLAKSYIELEKFKRAQSVLDNLENEIKKNPKISKKIILALPMARADMFIKQKKHTQAIDPLLSAIRIPQKKTTLARSMFILGQIYQEQGEYYKASDMYKRVIKKNPPYQMAFNSAINLATSYDTIYGESSKPIVKSLKKMLKEDKNIEYRDQIYYALADVAFKDGADTLAIDYLALSVASSVKNDYQKTTSALALGNIYFKVQEYRLAQAYYDTAVQVIPEDFPNRKDIELQTTYLTELVENLLVVITQDSLQRVALMPEDERMALIEKVIEDVIKEEERQKELEEIAALNIGGTSELPGAMGTAGGGGQWYFYNQLALSTGFNEFKKKWGTRKLEDNWRLSNKQSTFLEEEETELITSDSTIVDSTGAVVVVKSNDPHTPDYYLQDLPFTEEQVAISNGKIEEALFNLGFIYKDKLFDNPRAVESFETLIERFPETENLLQSYYQLYRLFVLLENTEMVEYYKNLIVENFPDSDYAKLLTDPNFFKQLEAEKNRALTLYSETYDHYESGHYFTVYSNSTRALEEFSKPEEILAKFEYLRALAIGKIEVVDSLQAALDTLISKYPESDVVPLAQNILDYIRGPVDSTGTGSVIPTEIIDVSIYEFNRKSKQIFALVVNAPVNVNALKVRISDYNSKYHSIESLSVTNILLDKSTHFIMVGNFETIEEAMKYYNSVMSNEYVFANLNQDQYNGFVIAQENYPVFYKDKDLKKYLAFFKQNYLKEK